MKIKNLERYNMPEHDYVQLSKTGGGIKGWVDVDLFFDGKYLYTALIREEDLEQ